MMVADNEVQADGLRVECFLGGTDPAIYSDDQFHAIRFEGIQSIFVEAIAFIKSVRNIAAHISAKRFQRLHEERGGRDAVHIIIAVDRDRLVVLQGITDAIHGGFIPINWNGLLSALGCALRKTRASASVAMPRLNNICLRIGGNFTRASSACEVMGGATTQRLVCIISCKFYKVYHRFSRLDNIGSAPAY